MTILYVDFVNKEVVENLPLGLLKYMAEHPNTDELREEILAAQYGRKAFANQKWALSKHNGKWWYEC